MKNEILKKELVCRMVNTTVAIYTHSSKVTQELVIIGNGDDQKIYY